jgi:hypothetical protein
MKGQNISRLCKLYNLTLLENVFHKWTHLETYSRSGPFEGRQICILIEQRDAKGLDTLTSTSEHVKIEGRQSY